MNEFDPNALSLSTDVVEEGMSVEDVSQMDAYAAL
jgi:hypothetical protein